MNLKTTTLVLLSLAVGSPAAFADENPYNRAYDAVYDHYRPSGATTLRLSSDGMGHLRSESNLAGRNYVSISDWNQKSTYTIDDSNKMVSKMSLTNSPGLPGAPPVDESKRTSLGEKTIDGHVCDGWQYSNNGHTTQSWTDKELGCVVLMTLDGKPQMRLKTCNKNSLPAQYFSVPQGYRVVDMNDQIRRAQELAKKYQQGGHR